MGSHTNDLPCAGSNLDTQRVLDSIRRIVQTLRVASRAAESRYGLTAAQLFVMQKLAEKRAASLNDLAARTLTHQSSVSVVVQKLVLRQLVVRRADRDDARRVLLSLTPAGRALVRKAPLAAQERLIAAVNALPAPQRCELARLLGHVAGCTGADTSPPLFFEEPNHRIPRQTTRASRH